MKTQNIFLTTVFSLFVVLASAQNNTIERSISKDVQKISNKSWLSSEHLLTVASVNNSSWIISKNVRLSGSQFERTAGLGNMISTGYPVWIISKRTHKVTAPRRVKPAAALLEPAIASL
jgi:hypothetical protein